jgi:hypothetical protein
MVEAIHFWSLFGLLRRLRLLAMTLGKAFPSLQANVCERGNPESDQKWIASSAYASSQ